VDRLKMPFARQALVEAARAAQRAEHNHARSLTASERNDRLRRALTDALDAAERIVAEASLSRAADASRTFASVAKLALAELPPPPPRQRGSPGRVVQAAAAEAASAVWSEATGRTIPRSGKVADDHPLNDLLRAIAADLFDSANAMSVSLLRRSQLPTMR
jgi:hypothetical protein